MQQNQQFHPISRPEDGLFNTHTGKLVNLHEPTENMISVMDIAAALSKICRFGGHSRWFYSVAQHSVLVSHLCGTEFQKEALMHDASEAYLGDVIKPLKIILGAGYASLEANFEAIIAGKYGLRSDRVMKAFIKGYDLHALDLEHQAFILDNPGPLLTELNSLDLVVNNKYAWPPDMAKQMFIERFDQLFK